MNPGLFFDLDGTLVESEPLHWLAWARALEVRGITLTWSEYQSTCIGHCDDRILNRFTAEYGWTDAEEISVLFRAKTTSYLDAARRKDLVPPPIAQLLRELSGFPLGLVTSSTRAEVSAVLEAACLLPCFSAVVSREDVSRTKPAPEPYSRAMRALGVSIGVAFEDSDSGIASAESAGLVAIRVATPADLEPAVRAFLSAM